MGKRLLIMATTVVLLAAATVGIAFGQTSKAAPRGASPTIHVVIGPGAHLQFLDFAGDGLTLGDRLAGVEPMLDPTQTKRVGTAYGDCWVGGRVLLEGTPYVCNYILNFGNGEIMTQGLDPHGPSDVFFAVTGGTGVFEGATGQAEYIDTDVTNIFISLG